VAEDAVKGFRVSAGSGGYAGDGSVSGIEVFGDSKGDCHVDAPRGAKVGECPEIHSAMIPRDTMRWETRAMKILMVVVLVLILVIVARTSRGGK
jgi:hypothetical protein